ncbi:hypothetical protein ED28_15955 [[Pantoea] beijingensis]|uniref:DUF4156 domain-containing protein n=1 Tax=[Pantoea] beijingensis TaxID=1324864 RepID=A0A443IA56_9GAMM|nr:MULTISPECIES: DUF4156 domain-containing protein [Erwiniaceae]RWR00943.1 hypothetical protein ED28_15955 [[Pantoea] beijingensis]
MNYRHFLPAFILLLAGCSANSLSHAAKNIRVATSEPPASCHFLGVVTGSQGNFLTGGWTSNKNLEQGALNELRNETAKLGGDVVSLITNRAGTTGSAYSGSGSSQETNVVMTGNAWRCNNQ